MFPMRFQEKCFFRIKEAGLAAQYGVLPPKGCPRAKDPGWLSPRDPRKRPRKAPVTCPRSSTASPAVWGSREASCNRTFPSSRNGPMRHNCLQQFMSTLRKLSCIVGGSGKWYNPPGRELAVSYKHTLTIWPSNPTPRHLPKRNKNICPHKGLFMNIHSSFIHNGLKLENNTTSASRRMNKQLVVFSYNGRPLDNKKELTTDTWDKMGKSYRCFTEWNSIQMKG